MSRYKCAICNRTRDEKFMTKFEYKIKEMLQLNSNNICQKEIKWHDDSNCKRELKKKTANTIIKLKILHDKM